MNHSSGKSLIANWLRAMLFCVLFQGLWTTQAMAQSCSPFMPCIVPFTPNDPFLRPISPNTEGPNAPKTTSDVCDADYMNQIYGNSFLEAQRETISAEAILLKPDSVMEYTCFDQLASQAAVRAPQSFSAPTLGLPPLIEKIVLEGLLTYINENFWHTFLGGAAPGLDTTITNTISGAAYVCPFMQEVFMVAKCSDFGLEAPFMSFEELITFEPRQLPRACTGGTKITQELINLANNADWFFAYFDTVESLLFITRPGKISCETDKPIPTGVIVEKTENRQDIWGRPVTVKKYSYQDKVCSNPACWFDNRDNKNPSDDRCILLTN